MGDGSEVGDVLWVFVRLGYEGDEASFLPGREGVVIETIVDGCGDKVADL